MLAVNPGFAAAAILSLAIGIGANTSIFSVANALLLRPLPYQDPDRLVILWNRSPGLGIAEDWFSTAQYFDIKDGRRGFEQVAIAIGGRANLTGIGEPERIGMIRMSSSLLPMLGVNPALGRLFTREDDEPGRAPVVLLSHGTWVRRFGSDPRVLGRTLTLNGQSCPIAGVLPRSFSLPRDVMPTLGGAEQADVILPLPLSPAAVRDRDHEDYNIIGKLRPGVSLDQAQAEMDTITARLRRDHPDVYPPNGRLTFSVVPLLEQVVGDVRRILFILLGSVAFVLAIAGANVANLLLSRAVARQKEIAMRAALGAGRARIVRQLLTESAVIAVCGGGAGVLLSLWAIHLVHVLGPKSIPRVVDVAIDGRVLLFTMAVSVVSGLLFGLAPALRLARIDLTSALKETGKGAAGGSLWGRGNRSRKLLVVAELALSVVLLIGAGLLIRSFARLQNVHPGFARENVLTLELTMSGRKYNDRPAVLEAYRKLWESLGQLPGVTAFGGTTALPLTQTAAWTPVTVEGRVPPPGEKFINADERIVAGRYFQAMQIPLLRGRLFTDQDTATNPPVVIVDEAMARQLWPGEDPVGKRIRHGLMQADAPWKTVVGVVRRVKHESLDSNPNITFYLAHTQAPTRGMTVVLRAQTDVASLTSAVKETIRGIDPDLPMYNVRTMEQWVDQSMARRRFATVLLTIFAGLAFILAALGIYGVMAYLVNQGTREVGIRMALGATQGEVVRMVVRQGMSLALAGVAIGAGSALVLTRFLGSLLYGVDSKDPLTFTAIPVSLAMVALVAAVIPARRAARVDPACSLRCE